MNLEDNPNAESESDQLEARVRNIIRAACGELGEEPGFVRLHVYRFGRMLNAALSVELPAGVQVLTKVEWHGDRWTVRHKRDPLAAFEIDVEDEELTRVARIVGAPADHARAVFTPNIRKWILAYRRDLEFSATVSRRFGDVFEHRNGAPPPWTESGLGYCEVRIWLAGLPPEDLGRAFTLELIAIARRFRAAQGLSAPMTYIDGSDRGVQPKHAQALEEARRRHEIAAYLDACLRKPRRLQKWFDAITTAVMFGIACAIIIVVVAQLIDEC